jgi:hypothetical protein
LVLIGPGEFSDREISQTLELPVVSHLPRVRHGAKIITASGFARGSAGRLPLVRAARSLAGQLERSPWHETPGPQRDSRPGGQRGERLVPPKQWGAARPPRPAAGEAGRP